MNYKRNILTLDEAKTAAKRDYDYNNEIRDLLPEIDAILASGTGVQWEEQEPIPDIAKNAARLKLQIELGLKNTPLDEQRLNYKIKQLQALALGILNG